MASVPALHRVGWHIDEPQLVEANTPHGIGVISSDVWHLYWSLQAEISAGITGDLPLVCLTWECVKVLARPP